MRVTFAALAAALAAAQAPEQIHISYTGKAGELAVDFVSTSATGYAAWSLDGGASWTNATTAGQMLPDVGYMHQALLPFTGVTPGQAGAYLVSAGGAPSAVFAVTPIVTRQEVFAVFGDFGLINDACMTDLVKAAADGVFDSVLHVGDWAYNLETDTSKTGNSFMNLMQGYAAIKPVMPVAGNHEACPACPGVDWLDLSADNFTHYRARFAATTLYAGANAGTDSNIYYSFNQGLSHFTVFSAEAYLYARSAAFLANQVAFMTADVKGIDRTATPWAVALVHKDWTMEVEAYTAFAPILEDGGVDVLFCGHVHYYNRYKPYDSVTQKTDDKCISADGSTYTEPKYLVTIVTGASGDHEDDSKCTNDAPSYTCSQNYGWGIYTAVNATTATWAYRTVKADGPGPVDYKDALTIVQHAHGPRTRAA